MSHNYQDDLAGLREERAFNYSASDLESASLDDLQWMKANVELDEFLDGEIESFKETTIQTQKQLVENIKETRVKYQEESLSNGANHSPGFYEILDNLLKQFEFKVSYMSLPDSLNDWWCYSFEIQSNGIKLMMNHFSWSHDYGSSYNCRKDETFMLLEMPAKMLTVSEYAKIYGVKPVTVRQWIRRAKIRSVVKMGREWRISELTEKPEGPGYSYCQYSWTETLTDLPEMYTFLSEFCIAKFFPDEDTDNVCVEFFTDPSGIETLEDIGKRHEILDKYPDLSVMEDGTLLLNSKQREKLELYMLSHPLIRCKDLWRGDAPGFIAAFGDGDYDGVDINIAE